MAFVTNHHKLIGLKPHTLEFLLWCSRLRIHCYLCSGPASQLRIYCYLSCGIGHSCGSDLIPGPGNFHMLQMCPPPKKNKKTTHTHLFFLCFCRLEFQNQSLWAEIKGSVGAMLPLEALGGESSCGGCQHFLACGCITPIAASLITWPHQHSL